MRLIHYAMLVCCLCLFPMAGLADGIVVGDDGSIGGGDEGGEEPQDDPTPTVSDMTAVDSTMQHLLMMERRIAEGTLPASAQTTTDVSRHGHEVVTAVHAEERLGRLLATLARSQQHVRSGEPRGRSGEPHGRSGEHRP